MAEEESFDIVCVGFGPAALSLAVALHEQRRQLRVLILERNQRFTWRGDDLPFPKARMRSSLLHDLVTQRNPQSDFTFVNYLFSTGSLIDYTNLGLVNPPRAVFSNYLQWAAARIEKLGWVQYGHEVQEVVAERGNANVDHWRVKTRDIASRSTSTIRAKRIVLAVGSQPRLPQCLNSIRDGCQVLHSSEFAQVLPLLLRNHQAEESVAVLGGNDEGVEIFQNLRSLPLNLNVDLFIEDAVLRQTDDNPL